MEFKVKVKFEGLTNRHKTVTHTAVLDTEMVEITENLAGFQPFITINHDEVCDDKKCFFSHNGVGYRQFKRMPKEFQKRIYEKKIETAEQKYDKEIADLQSRKNREIQKITDLISGL